MGKWAAAQHLRERAFERFGVKLKNSSVRVAVDRIKKGEGVAVDEWDDGRIAYLEEVQGIRAVWIYEPKIEWFVTVMSISMYGEGSRKRMKKARRKNRKAAKAKYRQFRKLKT
jgi:hypothetical protein